MEQNKITLEDLAKNVIFFTDAYIPNKYFDSEEREKFKNIADGLVNKFEQFDNFNTRYVRKNKARFLYERAGLEEKSLGLAKELVRDFEKEYPNPLHCIWPHYIDSLEHLFKEGDTELRGKS